MELKVDWQRNLVFAALALNAVVVFGFVGISAHAAPSKQQVKSKEQFRTLHFPSGFSCGAVELNPHKDILEWPQDNNYPKIDARGDVRVPVDARVGLRCSAVMLQKPEVLNALQPDDLVSLSFRRLGFLEDCDNIIQPISRLTGLRFLDLTGCEFSGDQALTPLKSLNKLESLKMWMTGITGACIKNFVDAKELRILGIGQNPLKPECFTYLSRFPKLNLLDVSRSLVTDAQLREIVKCKKLQELRIAQAVIDGKSLLLLKDLHELRLLDVVRTKLTADDIVQLKGLPLEKLLVSSQKHKWTPAEQKKVQAAFPKVFVWLREEGKIDSDTKTIFAPMH